MEPQPEIKSRTSIAPEDDFYIAPDNDWTRETTEWTETFTVWNSLLCLALLAVWHFLEYYWGHYIPLGICLISRFSSYQFWPSLSICAIKCQCALSSHSEQGRRKCTTSNYIDLSTHGIDEYDTENYSTNDLSMCLIWLMHCILRLNMMCNIQTKYYDMLCRPMHQSWQ